MLVKTLSELEFAGLPNGEINTLNIKVKKT